MSQVQIREDLARALTDDLVGPMAPDEVLDTAPSRWYLTGFLVPTNTPEELRLDPTAVDDLGDGVDDADDEGEGSGSRSARRPFLPSSVGLSFLVPPGTRAIDVTVRWGEYEQLSEAETIALRDADPARARPADGDSPTAAPFRYWRRTGDKAATRRVPVQNHERGLPIPEAPGIALRVVDRPVEGHDLLPGTRAVSVFVVNARDAEAGALDAATLFQVRLEVASARGFVPRARHDAPHHPDDARADVQFRDRAEWAVGHGVAVEAMSENGVAARVATTWVPRATVQRMRARDLADVSLDMRALAEDADGSRIAATATAITTAYNAWIEEQAARIPTLDAARRDTATRMIDDARVAMDRIARGAARVASGGLPREAFRLANAAMADAAEKARPGSRPAWRLFQLAFVLLNLDGATDPSHADRDRVELLFFPTGGGKTEAYLGIAAYIIALRRLTDAATDAGGAGVTVLLRYTLRLLTLDQLRRAAQLICALELRRRKEPHRLGPDRISIGLWVGKKASANKLADVREALPRKDRDGNPRPLRGPAPVPLAACPWCGSPLNDGSFALVPTGAHPQALIVACADETCPFSFAGSADLPDIRQGIPLVAVDEHVYRELPTMLVGTVDKFAALPWRGATGMLFGRVRARGPSGFYGMHEPAPKEGTPLKSGLRPPDLVLQDELHLISGPLGTMVGLYETAVDALCRDKAGRGPKIIASTATARRAGEQIHALFARPDVRLFPPQGLDDGDTFFAEPDHSAEKSRLYLGVAAPGRSMKLLISRVYTALLGAAQRAWEAAGPPGRDNPADTYMTLVAYFNALKELGGAQRLVLEEVSPRLRRLAGRGPVGAPAGSRFADRRIGFDVLELTSRQTTDQIAQSIAWLTAPYGVGKVASDVLLASSMISVGVDIPRLGLMVMNGQPRTVAEYIQATSRVGRDTPGLVVTVHNLARPRDRSHFERFTSFHEAFYRDVEATSVTPFSARAVDRGLAGLVVALTRHLRPGMAGPTDAARASRDKAAIAQEVADRLIARAVAHRDTPIPDAVLKSLRDRVDALLSHWTEITQHALNVGSQLRYSSWEEPRAATSLLSSAIDDLTGDDADHRAHFRAPTSMRDVEPAVHVWVDEKRVEGKR